MILSHRGSILISSIDEPRSETSQRQFSTHRENREKLWLEITPMNSPGSPSTMFTHGGLSVPRISTSESVGIHIKQSERGVATFWIWDLNSVPWTSSKKHKKKFSLQKVRRDIKLGKS